MRRDRDRGILASMCFMVFCLPFMATSPSSTGGGGGCNHAVVVVAQAGGGDTIREKPVLARRLRGCTLKYVYIKRGNANI